MPNIIIYYPLSPDFRHRLSLLWAYYKHFLSTHHIYLKLFIYFLVKVCWLSLGSILFRSDTGKIIERITLQVLSLPNRQGDIWERLPLTNIYETDVSSTPGQMFFITHDNQLDHIYTVHKK